MTSNFDKLPATLLTAAYTGFNASAFVLSCAISALGTVCIWDWLTGGVCAEVAVSGATFGFAVWFTLLMTGLEGVEGGLADRMLFLASLVLSTLICTGTTSLVISLLIRSIEWLLKQRGNVGKASSEGTVVGEAKHTSTSEDNDKYESLKVE